VAPSPLFEDVSSYATGLNILSNREQIVATYTEVASSNKVKQMAAESIGLESLRSYSVSSELLKGTNVIRITVEGPDPVLTQELANAIGTVMMEYAQGLYEVYSLSTLDEAQLPKSPVRPDKVRDISLAAVLGLILGGCVAFLVTYLEPSTESALSVNIMDSKIGVYNKQYFLQRLDEEMVRAKRNHYPLSMALIRVDNLNRLHGLNAFRVRNDALRHVAVLLKQYLRDEDLIAYLDDDVFALLLPDISGEHAQTVMEYLQTRVAMAPFQSQIVNIKLNLTGIVGIASYDHNGTGRNQFMKMATEALQRAEVSENGKVYLLQTKVGI
jgi:diguanylate cyclase (GGDEF)-like protein